jgi:hypothetical protein
MFPDREPPHPTTEETEYPVSGVMVKLTVFPEATDLGAGGDMVPLESAAGVTVKVEVPLPLLPSLPPPLQAVSKNASVIPYRIFIKL